MHLQHLQIQLDRLQEFDFKLMEIKCNILKAHVKNLGHLVSGQSKEAVPGTLESLKNILSPTNANEVKQILGRVDNTGNSFLISLIL